MGNTSKWTVVAAVEIGDTHKFEEVVAAILGLRCWPRTEREPLLSREFAAILVREQNAGKVRAELRRLACHGREAGGSGQRQKRA